VKALNSSHKTETVRFRVAERDYQMILDAARAEGFETVSQYLRFLVREDLKQINTNNIRHLRR